MKYLYCDVMKFLTPSQHVKFDFAEQRYYNAMYAGCLLGIPIHLIIAIFFFTIGINYLAVYNLMGIGILYYVAYSLSKGNLKIPFVIATLEVVIASLIATYNLGIDAGFHFYIILFIPLFFLYSKWKKIETILFSIFLFISYGAVFIYFENNSPELVFDKRLLFYVLCFNLSGSFIAFFIIISYFNTSIVRMEKNLKYINKRLSRGNDEKEVLLKEIHHRVKNNLHVVNSILEVQSMELKNKKLKTYLQDAQRRIISMASIHERMYGSNNLKYISGSDYIESLINDLASIYDKEEKIKIELDLEDIPMDLDTMAPLAFMINEIITNSYKHAFSEGVANPKIYSKMKLNEENIHLTIGDNGNGFEEKLEVAESSLGVDLIESFITELNAEYTRETKEGTVYRFIFNKKLQMPKIKDR